MQWRGRRQSGNVSDVRGQGGGGGGAGGIGLVMMIGRVFGIKGILVAVVIAGLLWAFGIVSPSMFSEGGGASRGTQELQVSPAEAERFEFVKVVLADTEDVWTREFKRLGRNYELPTLTVFRGQVRTACGQGNAAMGPFYCPPDRNVYIDLGFYDELAETFQAPGDFAQAYVIAHEVGHHVQTLLGTAAKVNAARGRSDANEMSVRLELQADFYAGVWANHSKHYLDHGDIEEAIAAANAIGDDAIQKKSQGRVVPHAFTHGTSAQRMRWFNKGLRSGKMEEGDTFSMPYKDL